MAAEPRLSERTEELRIANSRTTSLTFVLEPWGEEYVMDPGDVFQLVARGPHGDSLEMQIADDRIVVYGWSGSVVQLFHLDEELGAGLWPRTPAPPTPAAS